MDALRALQQRVSTPLLVEPGPSGAQLEQLFKAAMRAPDHANLKPWRFLVIEGEGRQRLGTLFAEAAQRSDPGLEGEALQRFHKMPLRAPTLVVVIAREQAHPKVPAIEQKIAAGAAAHALVLAAYTQGVGAMWRTGEMAYHAHVHEGLGLGPQESIIGFIYLGTPAGKTKKLPEIVLSEYVRHWP